MDELGPFIFSSTTPSHITGSAARAIACAEPVPLAQMGATMITAPALHAEQEGNRSPLAPQNSERARQQAQTNSNHS